MRSWEADAHGRVSPALAVSPLARANEASANTSDTRILGWFMRGLPVGVGGGYQMLGGQYFNTAMGCGQGNRGEMGPDGPARRPGCHHSRHPPRVGAADPHHRSRAHRGADRRPKHRSGLPPRSRAAGSSALPAPGRPPAYPSTTPHIPPVPPTQHPTIIPASRPPRSHLDCRNALILIVAAQAASPEAHAGPARGLHRRGSPRRAERNEENDIAHDHETTSVGFLVFPGSVPAVRSAPRARPHRGAFDPSRPNSDRRSSHVEGGGLPTPGMPGLLADPLGGLDLLAPVRIDARRRRERGR